MKKTLLMLICGLTGLTTLQAQTSISCSYRQYCDWNEAEEKFGNCSGYEESSLFALNKDQTMFIHTTETIKSAYYITSKEYDQEKDLWTYDVTSDVGNKYVYIFDTNNKEIRALYKRNGETRLLVFTIKATF